MVHFREGSHVHRLFTVLSVTGEYPVHSLFLLGKVRVVKDMVHRLTSEQTFRNDRTGEEYTCRMACISGKGYRKTVRIYRKALPMLRWLHPEAFDYYMGSFSGHRFPGDAAHKERNHRVAEAAAVCMGAGLEIRPYVLPELQMDRIKDMHFIKPSFYLARDIKRIHPEEANKTMFTRMTGGVFCGNNCYAVYNTRAARMKWNGRGEFKAMYNLLETGRMNAGITEAGSAMLVGESGKTALETLLGNDSSRRLEFRFDSVYPHVHFIPMSQEGMRQMKLLVSPDWRDRLLQILFEEDQIASGNGMFEHDAIVDGVPVLSHLDGDIARLIRFREGAVLRPGRKEVLCFPHQLGYLQGYLGDMAGYRVLPLDEVLEGMGLMDT